MVIDRFASSVTTMIQRPVAGPLKGGVRNSTPIFDFVRESEAQCIVSDFTDITGFPPRLPMPAMVLAPEPPEIVERLGALR